jgi:hypothetical protein
MAKVRDDTFSGYHLTVAAVVTTVLAVPLAFISTTIGVVVLVGLAFACARVGGRDAGRHRTALRAGDRQLQRRRAAHHLLCRVTRRPGGWDPALPPEPVSGSNVEE